MDGKESRKEKKKKMKCIYRNKRKRGSGRAIGKQKGEWNEKSKWETESNRR